MKAYTVIFYVDGDYSVETFKEYVFAQNQSEAWERAVRQAKQRNGARVSRDQWENATEIVTFDGHLAQSSH